MREGAALGILPGEADRRALDQERGERERLGVAPIEDFAYSIAGIIMLPSVWVLSLVYRERRAA